jgi:hypothetical protein
LLITAATTLLIMCISFRGIRQGNPNPNKCSARRRKICDERDGFLYEAVVKGCEAVHTLSAVRVARDAGALTSAGLASLSLIEEHGAARLPEEELYRVYYRADRLLKDTQDAEDITRLRACARMAMKRLSGMRLHDKNFTLYGAVREVRGAAHRTGLEGGRGQRDAGGSQTRPQTSITFAPAPRPA